MTIKDLMKELNKWHGDTPVQIVESTRPAQTRCIIDRVGWVNELGAVIIWCHDYENDD